jgi:hypothetical protein
MIEMALLTLGVVALVAAKRFVLHWYGIEMRPDED